MRSFSPKPFCLSPLSWRQLLCAQGWEIGNFRLGNQSKLVRAGSFPLSCQEQWDAEEQMQPRCCSGHIFPMPGILLRDVCRHRLGVQSFSSSCFPTASFGLVSPFLVAPQSLFCWISSNSDKIWVGWRKSEGFSLSLSLGKGLVQVQVFFLSLVVQLKL